MRTCSATAIAWTRRSRRSERRLTRTLYRTPRRHRQHDRSAHGVMAREACTSGARIVASPRMGKIDAIRDKVAIVGMGCCKFGENWDKDPQDMIVDAAYEAYQDAGIENPQKQIEAVFCGAQYPSK